MVTESVKKGPLDIRVLEADIEVKKQLAELLKEIKKQHAELLKAEIRRTNTEAAEIEKRLTS